MTKDYKILAQFIKDMSSETPDVETYMYVKDNISKYNLGININSRALKNRLIEIDTAIKFESKEESIKKSIFEFVYTSVVRVDEEIKDKKILEKIILVEVQKEIYPNVEKTLLNLLHNSGYPSIKVEKRVNFDELYKKNFN
jgi:preprotein translocase subunit SecB